MSTGNVKAFYAGRVRYYHMLTRQQWDSICAALKQGVSARRLAADHGVSHTWLNQRIPEQMARFDKQVRK